MSLVILAAASTNDAQGDVVTWASLATVAGASGAAVALVAFAKIFTTLTAARARQLAALLGVIVVEVAVVVIGRRGWAEYLLGLVVGVQAGLAASKTVDVAMKGFDHIVTEA